MLTPNQGKDKRPKPRDGRRKLYRMIKVGSVVFLGILFFVALGFAFHYYGKDGTRSLWWGVIAGVFALIGIGFFVQAYVLEPKTPAPIVLLPNIVFGDSILREPLVAGKKPWVDIVIINTSDVPAEGRFTDVTWRIVPAPFNNQLEYAYQGLSMDFDLAAHQTRGVHFDITYQFAKDDVDALNDGRAFLYLYAKGEYWAANNPDSKRPLPFCFVYNKDVPGFLAVCPKGIKIAEGVPGNITYPNPSPTVTPPNSTSTPLSIAERPYVVVESAYIPDLAPNKPLSPVITIVNKGRTPAQHLAMSLEIAAKAGMIYMFGFGKDSESSRRCSFLGPRRQG